MNSIDRLVSLFKVSRIVQTDSKEHKNKYAYFFESDDDYNISGDPNIQQQAILNAQKQLDKHDGDPAAFLENYRKHNAALELEVRGTVIRLWKRQEQLRFLQNHLSRLVDDGFPEPLTKPRMR